MAISIAFSEKFIRIPLRRSPHIHVGNALRMDWADVLAARGMLLHPRQSAVRGEKLSIEIAKGGHG